MLHRVEIGRTYDPEALAVVGAAFDRVWQLGFARQIGQWIVDSRTSASRMPPDTPS